MGHHSNLVPWQILAQKKKLKLRFARLNASEAIDADAIREHLSPRTKLVSIVHVSNVLGSVAPVAEIVTAAREVGAAVLLDACQSVPHMPVDVQALGVDFIVASGHKMCGPTGIGFLWGKLERLEAMPPWQGGGEMIREVGLESSTYAPPPSRFEAGTPPITEAIGLGAAIDYLNELGMASVHEYEKSLGGYLYAKLAEIPGLTLYGPSPSTCPDRAALVAFNHESVHPSDLATFLDQEGVAVRSGHHCTQPLHDALGVSSSARASLYIYNTEAEVDALVAALRSTLDMFASLEG